MKTDKNMTARINKLQKRHPGTRRQRSYHGAGQHSVQFFDKVTGDLVADYNLREEQRAYTSRTCDCGQILINPGYNRMSVNCPSCGKTQPWCE
jgi:hypothetical protein